MNQPQKQNNNLPDVISPAGAQILSQGAAIMQARTEKQMSMALRNEPRDIALIGKTLVEYAKYAKQDFFYYWIVKDKYGNDTVVKGLSIQAATQALAVWGDVSLETQLEETADGYLVNPSWLDLRTNTSFNRPYLVKVKTIQGNYDVSRAQEMALQSGISKAQRNVITKMIPAFVQRRMIESAMGEVMKELDEWISRDGRGKVMESILNDLMQFKPQIQFVCQKYGISPGTNPKEIAARNPKVDINVLVSMRTDIALLENGEYQAQDLFTGTEQSPTSSVTASPKPEPATNPAEAKPVPKAAPKSTPKQQKPKVAPKPAPAPIPESEAESDDDLPMENPFGEYSEPDEEEPAETDTVEVDVKNRFDHLIPVKPKDFTGTQKWWDFLLERLTAMTEIKNGELIFASPAVEILGLPDSNSVESLIKAIFLCNNSTQQNKIYTNLKKIKKEDYELYAG